MIICLQDIKPPAGHPKRNGVKRYFRQEVLGAILLYWGIILIFWRRRAGATGKGEIAIMASVDFKKLHGTGEVAAMLRHNDTIERLKHEHSNIDIDKTRTQNNIDYGGRDYTTTLERYKQRIAELDAMPGANRRKDRVTAFSLVIPAPLGLDMEQTKNWCLDVVKLLVERYGDDNMISSHTHFDEIHHYYDNQKKEIVESRPHIHAIVVPEIENRLNGKKFSSKANMKVINKEIDTMSRKEYGVDFMTGETPQKQRIERLKARSAETELKIVEQKTIEIQGEIQTGMKQITALKQARELLEKGNIHMAHKIIQKTHQRDDISR